MLPSAARQRPRIRPVVLAAALWALLAAVPAPAAAQIAAPSGVLVVGDSLAVGMRPALADLLAPREVVWDVRSGRTTPQGLVRLRTRLRRVAPEVVAVSLGTNDGSDPRRFAGRIRRVMAAIPSPSCVVWADVFRPARKGRYRDLNVVLRAAARRDRRLHVVPWQADVLAKRVLLPDGLHPDAAGYARRGRLFARAIERHCTGSA